MGLRDRHNGIKVDMHYDWGKQRRLRLAEILSKMALKEKNTTEPAYPAIEHHGAIDGVTGSSHELKIDPDNSVLIDCGLFQGAEISPNGSNVDLLTIDFPIDSVQPRTILRILSI